MTDDTSFPTQLFVYSAAALSDGGSLCLDTLDQEGERFRLFLNWSIAAFEERSPTFSVNGVLVPRGSDEEGKWLDLLRDASFDPLALDLSVVVRSDELSSRPSLDPSSQEYKDSIRQLAKTAETIATRICSEDYQDPRDLPATERLHRHVLVHVKAGDTPGAVRAYRKLHPEIGLNEARSSVADLLASLDQKITGFVCCPR